MSARFRACCLLPAFCLLVLSVPALSEEGSARARRGLDGGGAVEISGELKQWHKVTLTLDGPFADERDSSPNPFTDCRMTVVFRHAAGSPEYVVPGYFAADGDAGRTSAESGTRWRAHVSPGKAGRWTWRISFARGKQAALDLDAEAEPLAPYDGRSGAFNVEPSDKTGRDFRGKGRLEYVRKRYLRFAGTGEYFLKAGADSPENLLAYADFDGTWSRKKGDAPRREGEAAPAGLHRYEPHLGDWREGDPTWKEGKGKGLVGALNYLAAKGCSAFSFLTYNVGGDGDDVWPFVEPEDKFHYDCSKLDQWQIVLDHATSLGLYLHFKMQETENDDDRHGNSRKPVAAALDGGALGPARKLYCRELVARFAHELALNWNLGEENTQSTEEQRAMAEYIRELDPYDHPIVVHTYPDRQDDVYPPLLGDGSALTGASLQNGWDAAHRRTLKWIRASAATGRPWVVANDEQNPAGLGVPPDPGYAGFDGKAQEGTGRPYDLHDIRGSTLWGTLLAGGQGVEYYFGYKLPQNDLVCEDWRSRDRTWDYCRIALEFFRENAIPFPDMEAADGLIGNEREGNAGYCFAKPGDIYVVYLPRGTTGSGTGGTGPGTPPRVPRLDLGTTAKRFAVSWYDPRSGGRLQTGSVAEVEGPGQVSLGAPPSDPGEDWVVLLRAS